MLSSFLKTLRTSGLSPGNADYVEASVDVAECALKPSPAGLIEEIVILV
jgi:hypothetical protein